MGEWLNPIVYVLVIGGIAGFFIGYLIKKLTKIGVILGVFAFLLIYLVYTKAVNLDFDELGATASRFAESLAPLGFTSLASSAPFIGSFVVGLVLGLKKG